jgi:ATP-grasp domain
MSERCAVIVDGYSTGSQLAAAFAAHGVRCVHVQSGPAVPEVYVPSFRPGDFVENVVHAGDPAATAARLAAYRPIGVIPGTECGVMLADRLGELLGLPHNDPALSEARRDKSLMAQAVQRAGLRVPASITAWRVEDIVGWARANADWPVVVKPLASGGTDGVAFCHDEAEVAAAFTSLYGHVNRLGLRNEDVLAQSFLRGTQYFVNTVSYDGVHVAVEIWREHKKRINELIDVCDLEVLLPHDGEAQQAILAYTSAMLDALGIRYGAAHTELMLTRDGVALIEVGARLQGSMAVDAVRHALGETQVSLTALAYADPARFRERAQRVYEVRNPSWCVIFISGQRGTVRATPGLDAIRALRSYYCMIKVPKPGEWLEPTVDLWSSPGIVYLSHAREDVMREDYETIRALERSGALFEVAAPGEPDRLKEGARASYR